MLLHIFYLLIGRGCKRYFLDLTIFAGFINLKEDYGNVIMKIRVTIETKGNRLSMKTLLEYAHMSIEEVEAVHHLVKSVFDQYIASDYAPEGVSNFNEFIDPSKILERIMKKHHKVIVAKDIDQVIGVIETREDHHICLLFVHKAYHRMGVARNLIALGFSPLSPYVTVNASPYAQTIYEKLGFTKISGELVKNGITYIPMIKELVKK